MGKGCIISLVRVCRARISLIHWWELVHRGACLPLMPVHSACLAPLVCWLAVILRKPSFGDSGKELVGMLNWEVLKRISWCAVVQNGERIQLFISWNSHSEECSAFLLPLVFWLAVYLRKSSWDSDEELAGILKIQIMRWRISLYALVPNGDGMHNFIKFEFVERGFHCLSASYVTIGRAFTKA